MKIVLYGTKNWASDLDYNPKLTMSFCSAPVYSLKDNQFIYNSSKIGTKSAIVTYNQIIS